MMRDPSNGRPEGAEARPATAPSDGVEHPAQARQRHAKSARNSPVKRAARARLPRPKPAAPGLAAGIEYHELTQTAVEHPARVVCTDYSPERIETQQVADIGAFLAVHRPSWTKVRWIHVEGLQDQAVIRALAEKYQLHPLAIEDVLHVGHRPKLEDFPGTGEQPGRLFVVARGVRLTEAHEMTPEQIGFFLGRTTLLSFQQTSSPAIDEIARRLASPRSRVREHDASFLLYALIDALVDHYFPLLDAISERLELAEEEVLERPRADCLQALHQIKRDLVMIRRSAWPMRELVSQLQREPHEGLSAITQTYFRDVYDHGIQIIDLIETYREIASAVTETYVSIVSNRTNDIMKVLTIIGTIFIPLTFLAGVYGMNMPIPENGWRYTYPIFWGLCLSIAGFMIWRFRRGGWL
ncbi:magnesium/cobalt transporter CorA [Thiocystis violacea]|uniref:magnesium/cobalt transporter CorA n=1 Tax=Thiocystis violacea TaxID=13725 RepID=UPI001905A355|nr:magnesium/cobalt transporter CorA [Thiocystis violacea]MBK1719950.1 magnesium and cobalt transport protein CorA [Thiocystis violacea]